MGKLRKRRATLQDALNSIKQGFDDVIDVDDYVFREEREADIQHTVSEIESLLKSQIPHSRNLDLVILKCHLLLEYVLNQYIRLTAKCEVDISKERFSFSQKLTLVHILGLLPDSTTIPTLELFNRIRNQVAHTLSLDRKLIDLLIKINSEDPESIAQLDDKTRVRAIKNITSFYCISLIAAIKAHNELEYLEE